MLLTEGDSKEASLQVVGKRPFTKKEVKEGRAQAYPRSAPWTTRQGWSQPSRYHLDSSQLDSGQRREGLKECPANSSSNTDTPGFLGEGIGFEPSFSPWPLKNKVRI